MKKYELTDRLEYLMKIGLVDRSKLTQYKLAFRDPENNVKFKHYRDKILEVFFKIFDIVSDNNPIYEKVRQQVLINYRKNRDMKSRLNEAKGEKLKLGPEHQAMIDAHIKKIHDLRHTPEHLIKKHNELLSKYKEAKLPPSFSTAIQAKSVKTVNKAHEDIAARKSYETASKTREDKQFQRDVASGLKWERDRLNKSRPPRPISKDSRDKEGELYDRVLKIASKSKKPVGNFVQRTIQKVKDKMRPSPHEIATKAVARYRGNVERNKERKAAEEAVKKKALDPSNVAKVEKSRLAKRLIRMANEERKTFEPSYSSSGSARVNVTETLSQSGGRAQNEVVRNSSQEVKNDLNKLKADKNKAEALKNQQKSQQNRVSSDLNQKSQQHKGPRT